MPVSASCRYIKTAPDYNDTAANHKGDILMTKVKINPGVCGLVTTVTATAKKYKVELKVASGCESVRKMMEALGTQFDAFTEVLVKPGEGSFYKYASENFPAHAACPVISGIIKCMEAECRLGLKAGASIEFIDEDEA